MKSFCSFMGSNTNIFLPSLLSPVFTVVYVLIHWTTRTMRRIIYEHNLNIVSMYFSWIIVAKAFSIILNSFDARVNVAKVYEFSIFFTRFYTVNVVPGFIFTRSNWQTFDGLTRRPTHAHDPKHSIIWLWKLQVWIFRSISFISSKQQQKDCMKGWRVYLDIPNTAK